MPVQQVPVTRYRYAVASNAYVAVIWGGDPGFVLGALVLGQALKSVCNPEIDRVLLHTDDVGTFANECLQTRWKLKPINHVDATDRCILKI